jgi:hypothetical protein
MISSDELNQLATALAPLLAAQMKPLLGRTPTESAADAVFASQTSEKRSVPVVHRAIAHALTNPGATNAEIAAAIDCHVKYLSSPHCKQFKAIRKAMRDAAREDFKRRVPRGAKTPAGLEAWQKVA